MADKILAVYTITVSSTQQEISLPALWDPSKANGGAWGGGQNKGSQFFQTDKVIYIFDNFSGSFSLVQEEAGTSGVKIYDTVKQAQSGPWRLIAGPPRFLYNSGSNSQSVDVSVILVR